MSALGYILKSPLASLSFSIFLVSASMRHTYFFLIFLVFSNLLWLFFKHQGFFFFTPLCVKKLFFSHVRKIFHTLPLNSHLDMYPCRGEATLKKQQHDMSTEIMPKLQRLPIIELWLFRRSQLY